MINKKSPVPYDELCVHFTAPNRLSPFYSGVDKIPRKLKKSIKKILGCSYGLYTNEQRMWYYMYVTNRDYNRFIIKQICNN